jgi:hypothetical protein
VHPIITFNSPFLIDFFQRKSAQPDLRKSAGIKKQVQFSPQMIAEKNALICAEEIC